MLKEESPEKYKPYAAKCYYTHTGPPSSVLILEDLKRHGFRLAEKTSGLNMNHCLLVIRRIASYHAASAVLFQKRPDSLEPFMPNRFTDEMKEHEEKIYVTLLRAVANEVEKWPGFKERFSGKLYKITDRVFEHLMECTKRDDSHFNVLNHADLWTNNIMFLYDDETGDAVDLRLVDFQLSFLSSPAVDLVYFLCVNTSPDVLENHQFLLEEYHKTLEETLEMLGHKSLTPTIEHINEQLNKRCMLGIIYGIAIRIAILSHKSVVPGMSKGMGIQFSEEYKEALKQFLPIFEKKGWL